MKLSGVLPTTQFVYRTGPGTCEPLLCVSYTLQSALKSGQEARSVQIDFCAAYDRVNHKGILCELCCVGIGGWLCVVSIEAVSIKPITARYGG